MNQIKSLFTIGLLSILSTSCFADNSDSLLTIWNNETAKELDRLEAIDNYLKLTNASLPPDSVIFQAKKMELFARANQSQKHIGMSLFYMGSGFLKKGAFKKAITSFNKSLMFFIQIEDESKIASTFTSIGITYRRLGDSNNSLKYFEKALAIYQETGDENGEADELLNIGVVLTDIGEIQKSMEFERNALVLFEKVGDELGVVYALVNLGDSYIEIDSAAKSIELFQQASIKNQEIGDEWFDYDVFVGLGKSYFLLNQKEKGEEYANLAIETARKLKSPFFESAVYSGFGVLYLEYYEYDKAIEWCQNGLEISDSLNAHVNIRNSCECLYKAYRGKNNGLKALEYHDLYNIAQDSINADDVKNRLTQFELEKELLQDSLNYEGKLFDIKLSHAETTANATQQRNLIIYSGIGILLIAGGLFGRLRHIKKTKNIIEKEKQRSDELLLNILPAEIAQELKDKGKADARNFDMASILFTDFKGFTAASSNLSAQDLVAEINTCFEAFDGITVKYGIEKIKTIGDAYMAAGSLPIPTDDSVKNTVLAALEMQSFISARKEQMDKEGKPAFEMRVGIHTGPVVAGIVGVKKFQYDIWGDTVNTAARMESNGKARKVNISQITYDLVKKTLSQSGEPLFNFESRGKIEVKGKGEMEMWFVSKT